MNRHTETGHTARPLTPTADVAEWCCESCGAAWFGTPPEARRCPGHCPGGAR